MSDKSKNNDGLKIGELPELGIVSIDDVVFHEDPNRERVTDLVERLGADGVLRNPPIVARWDGSARLLLLDGANRITALRTLDFPHVLVQLIAYEDPGLSLSNWHHAIEYLPAEQLVDHAAALPDVTVESVRECPPADPGYLCCLTFPDGSKVVLRGTANLIGKVNQLRDFTGLYHSKATMDRVSYTNLDHLRRNYRNLTALVTFPPFTKQDLAEIAQAEVLLPSGVTRVLLPKRALRFNLQLDLLRAKLTTEEKNLWLRETIQQKIADKCIRFYREPTFFFDE
jgi:hypothetical protein